jgi:hypothetical protein
MAKHTLKHVLAHAEAKLKRTDTTFRGLSVDDVFPVSVELDNMADHALSDDDIPKMNARSMFMPVITMMAVLNFVQMAIWLGSEIDDYVILFL